jgi:hypothetical protein
MDDATNDRSTRLRVELILLGTAVFAGVMVAPSLWGEVYTSDDLSCFHLPLRLFYRRCVRFGQRFDWCSQLFCGFYLQGEGQLGMYHPLHRVLYAALPFAWAFNLELLLSYPALLLGTFLLLRRRSLPIDASLLGAYGFAFAGFAVFHYMHLNAVAVVAHFPYALLAIDWLMRARTPTGRAWGGLALAVVTGSELLLGYPQYVYFSLLAEGLYAALVWSEMRGWPRWLCLRWWPRRCSGSGSGPCSYCQRRMPWPIRFGTHRPRNSWPCCPCRPGTSFSGWCPIFTRQRPKMRLRRPRLTSAIDCR